MSKLIEEDFLNEERFAKTFAGGKFRMLKWGKEKITRELKARKVSEYCIKKALKEIDDDEYEKTFHKLLASAKKKYATKNPFETKNKIAKFLISKGYAGNYVWGKIKD